MSSTKKLSFWMRLFNIIAGVIFLILAFIVIIDFGFATLTLLTLLSISLLILGLSRIGDGIFNKTQSWFIRILKIVVGTLMLPIGIIVIAYPSLGVDILIILLASALITNGVLRIMVAGTEDKLPGWFRVLLIIVGLITIFLGIVVIVFTSYGFITLILLLSLTFIFNGIARIMYGLAGYTPTEAVP
ncbi:MAG: hypothetical protein HGN29_08755 [Asgard group archaeon]|nr:hypothetical protein [Asgard group archaeon]